MIDRATPTGRLSLCIRRRSSDRGQAAVASELTHGATAYEGQGRGGRSAGPASAPRLGLALSRAIKKIRCWAVMCTGLLKSRLFPARFS